jgi:hypothetical protein
MDVIRHQQKQRDMPSHHRILPNPESLEQARAQSTAFAFLTIESDTDMKLRARLHPVRYPVMQALWKTAIDFHLRHCKRPASDP